MNRQKILLVDDEPHNLQLLRQILKDDYTLIFAKNGEDALKNAVSARPDLILLDVMMPDMDGYEVCRQLKQDRRIDDIPVIFVTALADEHDEAHGFQVGGIDYITKPIRPLTLKHRVKVHLMVNDQYRASQELVAEKSKELRNTRLRGLMMLGKAAEYKDNETGMHVQRMSSGSRGLSPAPSPLRTLRETFTSQGSSIDKVPLETRQLSAWNVWQSSHSNTDHKDSHRP